MHYRLHFRTADAEITTTLEIGCKNDERAIAFVTGITPPMCSMELWQDDRLVHRLGAIRVTAGGSASRV